MPEEMDSMFQQFVLPGVRAMLWQSVGEPTGQLNVTGAAHGPSNSGASA